MSINPVAYVDADWANNVANRKSITGYLVKIGIGAYVWKSKRQATIALSTTEVEYMALTKVSQECIWIRSFLQELKLGTRDPIIIHEDNQSCIALAKNPMHHERTKHIDIKYHFIREKVANKQVLIEYVETEEQIADILTKPLTKGPFEHLREKLGLIEDKEIFHSIKGNVGSNPGGNI